MGREYIYWSEFTLKECPYCGGRSFIVSGFRKMEYSARYDGEVIEIKDENVEWRVIDGVECAVCGEDLSDEVGL